MIAGSNTWDEGTITFSGSDTSGSYTKVNFYHYTYSGSYTVDGSSVTITSPLQTWRGSFSSAVCTAAV